LVDIFTATVADHPERVALDTPEGCRSYWQLAARSLEVARLLSEAGIGTGDRVGIRIPSGTSELYEGILGILQSGAAYVPVDADDPDSRAAWIWDECDVAAVLGPQLQIDIRRPTRDVGHPLAVTDDAWVIFTSGSTGRPKGVAVSHRAAAAFVDAEARVFSIRPTDRVLAGLSVGFDASCEEMWLAWRHGAALVPAPRAVVRSGIEFGPWISSRRISVVSTVPTLAALWDPTNLKTVRLVILGGEACPDDLGWRLARGREVWNTYGPTEATVVATVAPIIPGVPITIGSPLDGWSIAVLDARDRMVPDGEVGELVIGGVGLARYLDPSLDDDRFAAMESLGWDRAYRTGDFVRRCRNGLEFIGRRDDQVKIGGRRIELREIQCALSAVPEVRHAVVVVQDTPAGDAVIVGYVVADIDTAAIRERLVRQLPEGMLPILVPMASMPVSGSGKVDRHALPWPPPDEGPFQTIAFTETEQWIADLWSRYLGLRPCHSRDDFFELGGTSLMAAKLASDLRERIPTVAVADLYEHRTLRDLATRLEYLGTSSVPETVTPPRRRVWRVPQLAGVATLIALTAPTWIVAILAYNDASAQRGLPRLGWPAILVIWLVLISPPGRILIVAAARWALLSKLRPGLYPRRSWLGTRVWFVDRLAQTMHIYQYGGTPWAPTIARLMGTSVGIGARLGTIPSPAGLTSIGSWATVEGDADVGGWWIVGSDLVIDRVSIGAGARVGTRALLMPGSNVGTNCEIEPGSVVTGVVPADQCWAGSPARHIGPAGMDWPHHAPPVQRHGTVLRLAYGAGLTITSLLPIAAIVPGLALNSALSLGLWTAHLTATSLLIGAPILAATFAATYAVLAALLIRALGHWIRPGWHGAGRVTWATWMSAEILSGARTALFPLYASLCTRWWLRLMGTQNGPRSEISTAIGLSPLVTMGSMDFIADDVVFNTGRSRHGWLHLAPIRIDDGVFLGNGAVINGDTHFGSGSLIGVQSAPPKECPPNSSWFGVPPLEFPRVPQCGDPQRTMAPTGRLVVGRAAAEIVRVVLPLAASMALVISAFAFLEEIGQRFGTWALIAGAPMVLVAAGIAAALVTAMAKWLLMGRYHGGEHPLWSWFVWRDEILNSFQEVVAGPWLLDHSLGSPVMNLYLRAMGTRVGRDVWCDTMTITEFDMVTLSDGCAVNRHACIETHLFHDRIMSIGPTLLGPGSTVGPSSVVLPDTTIGEGCCVGGRSVALRGECLPPRSRWHGTPVAPV
jgi:non-ribosomal peptide synthetase-like protein